MWKQQWTSDQCQATIWTLSMKRRVNSTVSANQMSDRQNICRNWTVTPTGTICLSFQTLQHLGSFTTTPICAPSCSKQLLSLDSLASRWCSSQRLTSLWESFCATRFPQAWARRLPSGAQSAFSSSSYGTASESTHEPNEATSSATQSSEDTNESDL